MQKDINSKSETKSQIPNPKFQIPKDYDLEERCLEHWNLEFRLGFRI